MGKPKKEILLPAQDLNLAKLIFLGPIEKVDEDAALYKKWVREEAEQFIEFKGLLLGAMEDFLTECDEFFAKNLPQHAEEPRRLLLARQKAARETEKITYQVKRDMRDYAVHLRMITEQEVKKIEAAVRKRKAIGK